MKSSLDILPWEAWLEVFDRVRKPTDLENCWRSCASWNSMLQNRRQIFLFDKVLPLLVKNCRVNQADVLNCRNVCKMWRGSVDNYLQGHQSHFKDEQRFINCDENFMKEIFSGDALDERDRRTKYPHLLYNFLSREKLEEFMERWELIEEVGAEGSSISSNPFMTRCIDIEDCVWHEPDPPHPRQPPNDELWKYVNDCFLPKFGQHIHCFQIRFYEFSATDLCKLAHVVVQCLHHLPNLKSLTVDVNTGNFSGTKLDELYKYCQKVGGQPPQDFTHVSTLRTYDIPAPLLNLLVGWFTKLQKLDVLTRFKQDFGKMDHLEFRKWKHASLVDLYADFRNSDHLLNLPAVSFPLRRLNLVIFVDFLNDWAVIANVVNHFGETLRELDLQFGWEVENEITTVAEEDIRLNLPFLEDLSISTGGKYYPKSFDFMLPLVSLKTLMIRRLYVSYANFSSFIPKGKTKIQIAAYEHRMYASNVWEMLPKLKTVTIKSQRPNWYWFSRPSVCHYKREKYELYKSKGVLKARARNLKAGNALLVSALLYWLWLVVSGEWSLTEFKTWLFLYFLVGYFCRWRLS